MPDQMIGNNRLRLTLVEEPGRVFIRSAEVNTPDGWRVICQGNEGQVFATSLGSDNAQEAQATRDAAGGWVVRLSGAGQGWSATELIELGPEQCWLRRVQTYRFDQTGKVAVFPGIAVAAAQTRYTFPLWAHQRPLAETGAYRADAWWALPFPFHVWSRDAWVAFFGVEPARAPGTLDFLPADAQGIAQLRVYYPHTTAQRENMAEAFYKAPLQPGQTEVRAGEPVVLAQVLGATSLEPGQDPLFEAERRTAVFLLAPREPADLERVADGIAAYYPRCQLWEPDALGPGQGWFLNMWVYTHSGEAQRKGPGGGYFDLGWGEGIAAEFCAGVVAHWQRTGDTGLLAYVDEMTRNMPRFRRDQGAVSPYYDRSDGQRFGDFGLGDRVWTHSAGHLGLYLAQLCLDAPEYPNPAARAQWLQVARDLGDFYLHLQGEDGDLPDIIDGKNRELNHGKRVTARLVVCGLWVALGDLCGHGRYREAALRLAQAGRREIEEGLFFYGTMIDAMQAGVEVSDGESAYYILEGLSRLCEAEAQEWLACLCRQVAGFAFSWTYFYDLPYGHQGITRGGQVCRMPDFPLIYPIGPAKAVDPLLRLAAATGDGFYRQMAGEMVQFIARYQWDDPSKPWHGGMIHALDQHSGKHWGPDRAGQVDTGMATGNSLAALERWLRQQGA
ncbi:MAG: hypothetical protein IT369_19705 [Candidatus Latescibacteria bacterium]|nr:hypothetical protein [Candidatus Latescibacterota bacterium]